MALAARMSHREWEFKRLSRRWEELHGYCVKGLAEELC